MIFSVINVRLRECKQTYRLLRGWKLCKVVENCDLAETSSWAVKVNGTPPYARKPFGQKNNQFFNFYEVFPNSSTRKRMWQRDFSLFQTTPRPYYANRSPNGWSTLVSVTKTNSIHWKNSWENVEIKQFPEPDHSPASSRLRVAPRSRLHTHRAQYAIYLTIKLPRVHVFTILNGYWR